MIGEGVAVGGGGGKTVTDARQGLDRWKSKDSKSKKQKSAELAERFIPTKTN